MWTNPTNWDALKVPDANSDVIITNTSGKHVVLNVDTTVASVTVGGGSTPAILDLVGVNLHANGVNFLNTNGMIEVISNSSISSTSGLQNSGVIYVPANSGMVSLTLNCNFSNSRTIDVETNSTLRLTSSNSVTYTLITGTTFSGPGTVQFATGNETLHFNGIMTVNGIVEMHAGFSGYNSWTGPGLFRWQGGRIGGVTFAPDFHVEVNGGQGTFDSCTNYGSIRIEGTNQLNLYGGTFYNNGLFQIESNCDFENYGGAFANSGTIKVPAGLGTQTLTLGCNFTNSGTIDVETNSTLELPDSGLVQSMFLDGSTFDGAGTIRFVGNNQAIECHGLITVNGTIEYQRPTGIIGSSSWTGPGLLRFQAGGIGGVVLAPDFHTEISGTFAVYSDSTNQGPMRLVGTNQWYMIGGTFYNQGSFQIESNCDFQNFYSTAGFENTGTILLPAGLGTQTASISCNFTNRGIIDAETNSTLNLTGFGSQETFVLNDGTTFTGPGTIRFSGIDGSIGCHGVIVVDGTVEIQQSTTGIGGQSTWTGPGLLRWQNGLIGGFRFAPDLHVEMSGLTVVYGECTNQGSIRVVGSNNLYVSSGTFHNSGLFQVETNLYLQSFSGTFENSGTIRVPTGLGIQTWTLDRSVLTNYGTIDVESNSALTLFSTNAQPTDVIASFNDGSVFAGAGTLQLPGEAIVNCLGTMLVSNTVEFNSQSAIQGPSKWTGPGLFRWQTGLIGDFTFAPNFHVEMSGLAMVYGDCTNQGSIRATGSNYFWVPSGTFHNSGLFQIESNLYLQSFTGNFENSGTMRVPAGLGTQTWTLDNCIFTNTGTVDVEPGSTLTMFATNNQPNDTVFSFFDGSALVGGGTLQLLPGQTAVSCTGTLNVSNTVEFDSQSIMYGPSKWTGSGLFRWLNGGIAAFTLAPDFHAEISGAGWKYLSLDCTNQGTLRWLGGGNLAGGGASPEILHNQGLIQVEADGFWWDFPLINEAGGTFRQLTGTLWVDAFTNFGTAQLNSGKWIVQRSFICDPTGTYQVSLGGRAPFTNFHQLYATNFAIAGSLQVLLTNGYSPVDGDTFLIANNISQSGHFSSVTVPTLSSNLTWHIQYLTNSVVLAVAAAPTAHSMGFNNGQFQFSFTGYAAAAYDIQVSTNLMDWTTVETNSPFSGSVLFIDTNSPSMDHRYYRCRIFE